MGLTALGMTWRLISPAYTGFFIEPSELITAASEGRIAKIFILLFILSICISLFKWYGSILGFVGLSAYYVYLTEFYGGGLLIWEADLVRGVPFGIGYVLAWISVLIILISGIMRLMERDDFKMPFSHWRDERALPE